ncbi:hypothetical protein EJ08DRAFT_654401 [Tothia fuscella]|uniref:Uncharacterized protein n=1 Tax=Tothia fuscella TaxID=1048955 RepID=A0A9P4TSQ7_9PEZI|nr:hypothetical protein EJ08DRAFT_654401 [Tothia fuscella]
MDLIWPLFQATAATRLSFCTVFNRRSMLRRTSRSAAARSRLRNCEVVGEGTVQWCVAAPLLVALFNNLQDLFNASYDRESVGDFCKSETVTAGGNCGKY